MDDFKMFSKNEAINSLVSVTQMINKDIGTESGI